MRWDGCSRKKGNNVVIIFGAHGLFSIALQVPDSLFLAPAKTWVPSLWPEAPTALRGARLSCCAGGTWCPRVGWQGPRPTAGCSPADAGRVRLSSGGLPCGNETVLKRRGYSAGGAAGGFCPQDLTSPVRQAGRRETVLPQGGGRRAEGSLCTDFQQELRARPGRTRRRREGERGGNQGKSG